MKILLIDDHKDTVALVRRMLKGWNHEVVTAGDLETALAFARSQVFDVIICDIALPDGSGYAFMSEARRNGCEALAIAISAYPYPPEVGEPKLTGFDHHLSKPFTAEQLQALLHEPAAA